MIKIKSINGVVIFNDKKLKGTHINVSDLKKRFNSNVIPFISLIEFEENNFVFEEEIVYSKSDEYISIRLFDVCIYNICNELNIFKNELCFEVHKKTINKWYSLAKKTLDYLEEVFEKNTIAGAIVFHGHLLFDACLLSLCKVKNVKYITLENTFNKNLLVWDDLSGFVVTYNLAKNYFFKEMFSKDDEVVKSFCEHYLSQIDSYKTLQHSSNSKVKFGTEVFTEPYVLYICQVYNDASQLFTLEYPLNNPIIIIKGVAEICKSLGVKLVIKLHPKEINGTNPVTFKNYNAPTFSRLSTLEIEEHIFIDKKNEFSTYDLIQSSSAVVTVNSQAGLEASLFDKPVLTYFKGFYSGLGFTYDYADLGDLRNKLEYILCGKLGKNRNLSSARSFFFIFNEKYCIKKSESCLYDKIIDVFNIRISRGFRAYKHVGDYVFYAKIFLFQILRFMKISK
jgi:capsule polysaccharide export protein KpsC/LpsZ